MRIFFKVCWTCIGLALLVMLGISTVSAVYLHIFGNREVGWEIFGYAEMTGWCVIPVFAVVGIIWTIHLLLTE